MNVQDFYTENGKKKTCGTLKNGNGLRIVYYPNGAKKTEYN